MVERLCVLRSGECVWGTFLVDISSSWQNKLLSSTFIPAHKFERYDWSLNSRDVSMCIHSYVVWSRTRFLRRFLSFGFACIEEGQTWSIRPNRLKVASLFHLSLVLVGFVLLDPHCLDELIVHLFSSSHQFSSAYLVLLDGFHFIVLFVPVSTKSQSFLSKLEERDLINHLTCN